jgi:hypothetical protein
MKTNLANNRALIGRRNLPAALAALLLFGAHAIAQLQPKSPAGTWDCTISGARSGVSYVTFTSDGRFYGTEILVPKVAQPPRQPLVFTIPTTGLGVRPPATNAPSISGAFYFAGSWGFDAKGRTIGYFTEAVLPPPKIVCLTNPVVSSETITLTTVLPDGSVSNFETTVFSTNVVESCTTNFGTGFTNAVNLVGSVVPGKRLTLVCSSPLGGVTFSGVPAATLTNLSGDWYGIRGQNGFSSYEFFTLGPIPNFFPNAYAVDGQGPDYSYSGIALLSSQKQIAFALDIPDAPGGEVIRTVMGSFSLRKLQSSAIGFEQPPGFSMLTWSNRMSFQVTKRTSVP